MKKILLLILILAPAIWAGATWFTSQNTEAVLDDMLAQSNQQISETVPFLTIEKKSFDKGFTQSAAQSVITIDPAFFGNKEMPPITIGFNHTIYHGPLMMTPNGIKTGSSYILTTLDQASLSEEVQSIITTLFGDEEPFVSGVTTGTGDMIDTDVTFAPFSINAAQIAEFTGEDLGEEQFEFSFDGITGDFTSNVEGTIINGVMKLGEINIKGNDGDDIDINFTMAPSTIDMDVDEFYKSSILDGKITMTIPSFLFSDGKGTDVIFKDLYIVSSAEHDNGLMNASAIFDIDTVHIKSSEAGFNFPDSKVHMKGSISGIERTAVIKLIDLEQEMNMSQMSMLSGDDAEIMSDEILSSMLAYYRALGDIIKQGVNTQSVLEISNETGNAAVHLDLNYTDAKQLFALKTVKELALALQGSLAITIDKSMLTGTPLEEVIAMPIMMGFAVEKEERYESIANLNAGELLLNGQPVPFLDMIGDEPLAWDEIFGM
ncbi:MAG: hypothetical protein COA83_09155 [Methylophaga sp.]|nr:MAG: hypothetical protein COA83_09155 [Methylophaga sp.]